MVLGGVWRVPAYWPGGVRHEGGVSPVCGSCMEREKAGVGVVLLSCRMVWAG